MRWSNVGEARPKSAPNTDVDANALVIDRHGYRRSASEIECRARAEVTGVLNPDSSSAIQ
jgi:hypothetical protein